MSPGKNKSSKEPALVQVYVASGLLQAEIIKGRLESTDIPTLLKYESLGPVLGLTLDGLGQVQVLVPADQAARARALLADSDGPSDSLLTD